MCCRPSFENYEPIDAPAVKTPSRFTGLGSLIISTFLSIGAARSDVSGAAVGEFAIVPYCEDRHDA